MTFKTLEQVRISGGRDLSDDEFAAYHRERVIVRCDTIAEFRLESWQLQHLVYVAEKGTVYSYQPSSVQADDGDAYIHDADGRVYKKEGFTGAAIPGDQGEQGVQGESGIGLGRCVALLGSERGLAIDFAAGDSGKYALRPSSGADSSGDVSTLGTLTSASSQIATGRDGLLASVAANTLAMDYKPAGYRGQAAQFAGSRTNLIPYSSDLDRFPEWNGSGGVTCTQSGDLLGAGIPWFDIVGDGGNNNWRTLVNYDGSAVVMSFYVRKLPSGDKAGGRPIILHPTLGEDFIWTFDFVTKTMSVTQVDAGVTIHGSGFEQVGFETYRVWVAFEKAGATAVRLDLMDQRATGGASSAQFAAVQLEYGKEPSPYILTTTAAVSRSASVLDIPLTPFPNIVNGVSCILDFEMLHGSVTQTGGIILDVFQSGLDRFYIRHRETDTQAQAFVRAKGVTEIGDQLGVANYGQRVVVGISVSNITRRAQVFMNGVKIDEAVMADTIDWDVLNDYITLGPKQENGIICSSFVFIDRALSEAEMLEKTAL